MRTAFVELRGSPLLKAPLRIEGEYQRPDDDTLVREVRSPYAETTTLRNGEATIARAGKAPRKFSLARVPELAGLQASFGALLSGDRALLEKHYRLSAQGTRQQWTLSLVPLDAQMQASVRDITLYGRGAELRCIETRPAKGDLQRTLLAGAAHAGSRCGHDRGTGGAVPRGQRALMLTARSRLALALLWLALLVVAGWAIGQRLQLSGDLRKFMPAAETPAQKLLIDELGEGPGSRLLLMSISGADAATLAAQSQALREAPGGASRVHPGRQWRRCQPRRDSRTPAPLPLPAYRHFRYAGAG